MTTPPSPSPPIVFDAFAVPRGSADGHLLSVRMGLPSPNSRRFHFEGPLAANGLMLVTLRPTPRARPLVLVADVDGLGLGNQGASATNAAERIVAEFSPVLADVHHCDEAELEWIAFDSMGLFDRWTVVQGEVEIAPVLAPDSSSEHRSKQAFYATYGEAGRQMFLHLLRLALAAPGEEPDTVPVIH